MLEISDNGRTWLLSGPTSSYAVHLTEGDELLHLHWGPRIALADAEALAVRPLPDYRPFEAQLDGHEEYLVEGGPRFARPALSVRTDERRGTEWHFEAYEADGGDDGELRLRFRDGGLTLTLHYRMRHDVVERWVTLDNEGTALELLRADSATWTLPEREDWRLSQLHGRWAAESRLTSSLLTYGEKVIGSRRGHTGHQHLPWVALDTDATEERGEVYGCALGWSGSWRITVAHLADARVQITGGAGYDDSGLLRLDAGSRTRRPSSPACGATAASAARAAPGTPISARTSSRTRTGTGRCCSTPGRPPSSTSPRSSRGHSPGGPRRSASSCSWSTTAGSASAPATGPDSATGPPTPTASRKA